MVIVLLSTRVPQNYQCVKSAVSSITPLTLVASQQLPSFKPVKFYLRLINPTLLISISSLFQEQLLPLQALLRSNFLSLLQMFNLIYLLDKLNYFIQICFWYMFSNRSQVFIQIIGEINLIKIPFFSIGGQSRTFIS